MVLKGKVSDLQKHRSCVCAVQMPTTLGAGVRQAPENGAAWAAALRPGRGLDSPINKLDRGALPARGRGAAKLFAPPAAVHTGISSVGIASFEPVPPAVWARAEKPWVHRPARLFRD
jgi:hypothetical protein